VKVDWHDSSEAGSRKVVYYCTVYSASGLRLLLLFLERGRYCQGVLCRACHQGVSFFEEILYMCKWDILFTPPEGH
jgi:hypothetical protein